jgi:hypothetical protein
VFAAYFVRSIFVRSMESGQLAAAPVIEMTQ